MAAEPFDPARYRANLIEITLVTVIATASIFCFCALSITYDIHQGRIEQLRAMREVKLDSKTRLDQLMWKADTALEIGAAFKTELGGVLTKLRAQVKQASDESTKASRIETHETNKAVAQAIQKSTETVIAASKGETPDTTTGTTPDKPITVNVPPSIVVAPSVPVGGGGEKETTPAPKRRHWWGWLLVWRR